MVYVPIGVQTERLDLSEAAGTFTVQWYNPRDGGPLKAGSLSEVEGGKPVSLGDPPVDPGKDWVILVRKK